MAVWSKRQVDKSAAIALLLVGCLVTVVVLVWSAAAAQDNLGQRQAFAAVRQALAHETLQVSRAAQAYAQWHEGSAVSGPHHRPDLPGIELALVVDGENRITSPTPAERVLTADAAAVSKRDVRTLAEQARGTLGADPAPVTGFLPVGDEIAIAAASPLPRQAEGSGARSIDPAAVVVLVRKLSRDFLDALAADLQLGDLGLARADTMSGGLAQVPIHAPDGRRLGSLTWSPARPVGDFLRDVAPALAFAVAIVIAGTALVLGHARRVTSALEVSEMRFRDLADASSDWIWETDREHRLSYLSDSFAEATGLALTHRCGMPFDQVFRADDGTERPGPDLAGWRAFRDVLCRCDDPSGLGRTVRVSGKPVFDAAGQPTGFRGTATDITAEIEAGRRASFLALHDPLTGLANRSLLNDRLAQVLASVGRRGDHAALLLVDVDRFKDVNETLGHPVGDRLLQLCAERLSACVREGDTVARIDGDEFAVIQTAVARPADASLVCERILRVFAQPFALNGHEIVASVSIGCALIPDDGSIPETLLKKADLALHRAKDDGRDAYRFFEPEMDARLQRRKLLEHDLRRAIARNEFELYFQPKIALGANRLVGVEALVRWNHPERGLIPPAEFVGVAEETGLIVPLGAWVLRETCRRGCAWPDLHVAVNISPVQFRRSDLVGLVARTLSETGLPPHQLELEITESVLIGQPAAAADVLRALKQHGVRVAVDDFGTGYSSLSYLHRFPFDKIKVDRSFIGMLGAEAAADAVVRAVIRIARDLGMSTCAEGVETERQMETLVAEGCDEAQGFLFGKPMTAEAFEAFRRAWPATAEAPRAATAAA